MSKTRVVNIRKETCDVYIGRAGHGKDGYFGNPFRTEATMTRGGTLGRYIEYFYHRLSTDKEFRRRVNELQGRTLGCFYKPNPCHGDIIKEYLDLMAENPDKAVIAIGQMSVDWDSFREFDPYPAIKVGKISMLKWKIAYEDTFRRPSSYATVFKK